MAIQRLNHAVLYVRDADRTAQFYRDLLGFTDVYSFPGGRFMLAPGSKNDHDIAFFSIGEQARESAAGHSEVGLYHLAWQVETLGDLKELRDKLAASGALVGSSDHGATKALYAKDPDGIEFEVSWILPLDLLPDNGGVGTLPLDLEAEIERFGAGTAGRAT